MELRNHLFMVLLCVAVSSASLFYVKEECRNGSLNGIFTMHLTQCDNRTRIECPSDPSQAVEEVTYAEDMCGGNEVSRSPFIDSCGDDLGYSYKCINSAPDGTCTKSVFDNNACFSFFPEEVQGFTFGKCIDINDTSLRVIGDGATYQYSVFPKKGCEGPEEITFKDYNKCYPESDISGSVYACTGPSDKDDKAYTIRSIERDNHIVYSEATSTSTCIDRKKEYCRVTVLRTEYYNDDDCESIDRVYLSPIDECPENEDCTICADTVDKDIQCFTYVREIFDDNQCKVLNERRAEIFHENACFTTDASYKLIVEGKEFKKVKYSEPDCGGELASQEIIMEGEVEDCIEEDGYYYKIRSLAPSDAELCQFETDVQTTSNSLKSYQINKAVLMILVAYVITILS